MRKIIPVVSLISLLFVFFCSKQPAEKFSFIPQKPQAGQQITVQYFPRNTELENAESVEMLAYQFFADNGPAVIGVDMEKSGSVWKGSFTPADSATFVAVNFRSGEKKDNNDRAGYFIPLYDTEGNLLPEANVSKAHVLFSGAYPVDIKRDPAQALEVLTGVFSTNPELKAKYLSLYLNIVYRADKENGTKTIKAIVDSIDALSEKSLAQKELLVNWYRALGEQGKAEKYKNEVIKENPKSILAEIELFRKFRSSFDNAEKIAIFKKYIKDFPDGNYGDYMATLIVRGYAANKQFDKAEDFIFNIHPKPNANMCNTLAWQMVTEGVNLESAARIARKGVELAREALNAPLEEKPASLTEKEWRERQKYPLGMVLDTYAAALLKLNRSEEAVPLLAEAVEILGTSESDICKRYVEALNSAGQKEKALDFMKEILAEGNGFEGIDDAFAKAYKAVKGSEEGLSEILAELKQKGQEKQLEELKKEMLPGNPAPEFSLEDLDGNQVSLQDYRGKVVIIDFWATWCGPCKASFPGMQKAVDKFKDDAEVAFLFINTWERGEGIKEKVSNFIKDNKYTFHVLLDSNNEVVEKYGVEGIPTKFIVDKQGNIKFKSVGYGGNEKKLVDELSLMIELLK